MINKDTICAISTAPGMGAVALVRVSGADAISICNKIYYPKKKDTSLLQQKSYTLSYGQIRRDDASIVDEVMLAVFRNPHSYTGEDTVEINCHGSQYVQQQILQLLVEKGCRLALPGEFSQRAFLNGKMDLSQAEAVADLISSSSAAMHRLAINQMRGGFSQELEILRDKLLQFVSLVELELDFSEEDVEFADRTGLQSLAELIFDHIQKLANSFSLGNVLKNGVPVAIIGETNVGKSTLLNVLLNEDKAIVSDIHGTTRDVIEDTIVLNGITYRFIDTAGIRETQDLVENLGIKRTYKKINQANIVLMLVDATEEISHIENFMLDHYAKAEGKQLVIVFNKADLILPEKRIELESIALPMDVLQVFISAKEKQGIDELQQILADITQISTSSESDLIVTNVRHYEALTKALDAITRVKQGLLQGLSGDLLAQDIRECMHFLGEITGTISTDEILGNVFENFCIGK